MYHLINFCFLLHSTSDDLSEPPQRGAGPARAARAAEPPVPAARAGRHDAGVPRAAAAPLRAVSTAAARRHAGAAGARGPVPVVHAVPAARVPAVLVPDAGAAAAAAVELPHAAAAVVRLCAAGARAALAAHGAGACPAPERGEWLECSFLLLHMDYLIQVTDYAHANWLQILGYLQLLAIGFKLALEPAT